MTSDADDVDSDGTSPDTIFRELCMLRCSSRCSGCKANSNASSQYDPTDFSSFYASKPIDFDLSVNVLEPESWKSFESKVHPYLDNSTSYIYPFYTDSSTQSNLNYNWFKLKSVCGNLNDTVCSPSLWSRNLLSESLSRSSPFNSSSRGTDPPQFNNWFKVPEWRILKAKSDCSQKTSLPSSQESSVEYLVRERCSSPDCACDKRYQTLFYQPRIKLVKEKSRAKSVGSQVSHTSLVAALNLADWTDQIVLQEENWGRSMESSQTKKRTDSDLSVPSVLRLCRVSSESDHSSDSAITFLKKCSDCNILNTLGLKRDSKLVKTEMGCSQTNDNLEGRGKGQMVETYGKLLNKIEKLKKITSWKSKRRKNKLKYTLQGNNYEQDILKHNLCSNDEEDKCNWGEEEKRRQETTSLNRLSSGDTSAVIGLSKAESEPEQYPLQNHMEDKEDDNQDKQATMTCEIGIQSVQSDSFMTTIESLVDHNYRPKKQERKVTQEDAVIQTATFHQETNENVVKQKDTSSGHRIEKVKSRRVRAESDRSSMKSCNLFHGVDESLLMGGDRETREEILEHLRGINKLIERESCASSTHRTCQSERSLGFEAQQITSPKRYAKLEVDKADYTKHIKKEGRVYWAVTKVTVYPDACRTYEVMRLSRRRPQNVPSTSETVFVLLPNK